MAAVPSVKSLVAHVIALQLLLVCVCQYRTQGYVVRNEAESKWPAVAGYENEPMAELVVGNPGSEYDI